MRVVLELRPRGSNKDETDLWVLKSNFLEKSYKQKSFMLKFKDGSVFENTQRRTGKNPESKVNDPAIIDTVLRLEKEGNSLRKIAEMISKVGYPISKTTFESILKIHKFKG
jgi:hypothetical protein